MPNIDKCFEEKKGVLTVDKKVIRYLVDQAKWFILYCSEKKKQHLHKVLVPEREGRAQIDRVLGSGQFSRFGDLIEMWLLEE